MNATVVRVAGRGLVVQPRPKTAAGWRVVAVPEFAVQMLRARQRTLADQIVFTAPIAGGLRDPNNVSGDLRQLLDSIDCEACGRTGFQLDSVGSFTLGARGQRLRCVEGPWSWVTSHTFRKTVATRLDEAGFTPRQVADQLGHANPSIALPMVVDGLMPELIRIPRRTSHAGTPSSDPRPDVPPVSRTRC